MRECFAGVLEVTLSSAQGLASADLTGKSDPYVVAAVGDSAHRSATRLFTLDPQWNETFRLFVRQPDSQARGCQTAGCSSRPLSLLRQTYRRRTTPLSRCCAAACAMRTSLAVTMTWV